MKIAILGTRGIPNNYGGFEQFAEYLSEGLVARGHAVSVYTSHNHPYQGSNWKGVQLIHKLNPEKSFGTLGQFIYDFLCIWDSRKRKFDIIYQLGYTSSAIWFWALPRRSVIVTNMDGLEWKRSKFSRLVQEFLKISERLAAKTSGFLIADSKGIQKHLRNTYKRDSEYIAYGTHVFENPDPFPLANYSLQAEGYNMLIARMEPENNIETILDGVVASKSLRQFLVVGKVDSNQFGKYLVNKFRNENRIRFLGAIYNLSELNNLRYYSHLYFHGHSVGGTNPSLLEAMGSNALICAHSNEFNGSILEADGFYFSDAQEVSRQLDGYITKASYSYMLDANVRKIKTLFLWDKIITDTENFFRKVSNQKNELLRGTR